MQSMLLCIQENNKGIQTHCLVSWACEEKTSVHDLCGGIRLRLHLRVNYTPITVILIRRTDEGEHSYMLFMYVIRVDYLAEIDISDKSSSSSWSPPSPSMDFTLCPATASNEVRVASGEEVDVAAGACADGVVCYTYI